MSYLDESEVELVEEHVQVAIPKALLAKLFASSQLKPKDLLCLDEASKQAVHQLCLQGCLPKNCQHCLLHDYCAQAMHKPTQKHLSSESSGSASFGSTMSEWDIVPISKHSN